MEDSRAYQLTIARGEALQKRDRLLKEMRALEPDVQKAIQLLGRYAVVRKAYHEADAKLNAIFDQSDEYVRNLKAECGLSDDDGDDDEDVSEEPQSPDATQGDSPRSRKGGATQCILRLIRDNSGLTSRTLIDRLQEEHKGLSTNWDNMLSNVQSKKLVFRKDGKLALTEAGKARLELGPYQKFRKP